jgi:GTPase SAR1 family protein
MRVLEMRIVMVGLDGAGKTTILYDTQHLFSL